MGKFKDLKIMYMWSMEVKKINISVNFMLAFDILNKNMI